MTQPIHADELLPEHAVSRRNLLIGGGGAAAALIAGTTAVASGTVLAAGAHPQVLGATSPALQYLQIDELEFFPDGQYNGGTDPRYVDPITGVGVAFGGGHTAAQLSAPITLPVGSVIRQINVGYFGAPIVNIFAKPLATPATMGQFVSLGLSSAGANPRSQTIELNGSTAQFNPITIEAAKIYTIRFYVAAGDTLQGVTIGYTAPLQGFVAATGDPRVLDTRTTGGKLAAAEERSITVGIAGARSVLFNLAVVNTEGTASNPGGFVAAFPANIAYPGNSSINWFGAGQILSNSVLSAVDGNGAIKIRGGANRTDVVIDRIGYFF